MLLTANCCRSNPDLDSAPGGNFVLLQSWWTHFSFAYKALKTKSSSGDIENCYSNWLRDVIVLELTFLKWTSSTFEAERREAFAWPCGRIFHTKIPLKMHWYWNSWAISVLAGFNKVQNHPSKWTLSIVEGRDNKIQGQKLCFSSATL